MKCIKVLNEQDTRKLGIKLGRLLSMGDVLALIGDLGTGKTSFTKGLGQGMGIREDITSPTFTLVQEYDGPLPLYHFDVYRIDHIRQMEDIPYDEYFYGDGVCVIEWAEIIKEILPEERLDIHISYLGDEEREICFRPRNEYYNKIIEELV